MKNDFESWMKENEKNQDSSAGKTYESWPEEVKNEISMMLAANDAGTHHIRLRDATERFEAIYDFKVNEETLRRYAKNYLGRKSWSEAGSSLSSQEKKAETTEIVGEKIEKTKSKVEKLIEKAQNRQGFIPGPNSSTPFLRDY